MNTQTPDKKICLDLGRMRQITVAHIVSYRSISEEEAERRVDVWQANNPQPDDATRTPGRELHKASAHDARLHATLLREHHGVHPGYLQRVLTNVEAARPRESAEKGTDTYGF